MSNIIQIIDVLQSGNFYGGGKHIEIAKGKNELVTDWISIKNKIKRQWRLRKI